MFSFWEEGGARTVHPLAMPMPAPELWLEIVLASFLTFREDIQGRRPIYQVLSAAKMKQSIDRPARHQHRHHYRIIVISIIVIR